MPLKPLPFTALKPLLRKHLSREEDEGTIALVLLLRPARQRGYLTKGQLERICRWKSARALPLVRQNTHHRIRDATRAALSTRSERRRLEALMTLRGVSVPMASAILTLLNPHRYGVIDIRVWQLLEYMGVVRGNKAGVGLTFAHWDQFLTVIRELAAHFNVSARDIERSLFYIHDRFQAGTLYHRPASRAG
jgi:hypothetical protein